MSKFTVICFAVAMLAAAFSGCNGDTKPKPSPPPPSTSSTTLKPHNRKQVPYVDLTPSKAVGMTNADKEVMKLLQMGEGMANMLLDSKIPETVEFPKGLHFNVSVLGHWIEAGLDDVSGVNSVYVNFTKVHIAATDNTIDLLFGIDVKFKKNLRIDGDVSFAIGKDTIAGKIGVDMEEIACSTTMKTTLDLDKNFDIGFIMDIMSIDLAVPRLGNAVLNATDDGKAVSNDILDIIDKVVDDALATLQKDMSNVEEKLIKVVNDVLSTMVSGLSKGFSPLVFEFFFKVIDEWVTETGRQRQLTGMIGQ